MRIRSKGIQTDLIFHRFDGQILDRGEYVVVRTPSNPTFYYGNAVIFSEVPHAGSLERWSAIFSDEFRDMPEVRHMTFQWDAPNQGLGDVSELVAAGFRVDHAVVLTTRNVHPPLKAAPAELAVRPLHSDADWNEATELQIQEREPEHEESSYRRFKQRQMRRYRAMADASLGHWLGAYLDGKMVANLGLYRDGTLGRFQTVVTHSSFRRRGICGQLVYQSARFGLERMGLTDLVMIADENYHAARIYESVGFTPTFKEYSACRHPLLSPAGTIDSGF